MVMHTEQGDITLFITPEDFEKQIIVLSNKLDDFVDLGKHVVKKIETFDNTVNNTKKASIENNARTEKLENLIKKMETRLDKLKSGKYHKEATKEKRTFGSKNKSIGSLL